MIGLESQMKKKSCHSFTKVISYDSSTTQWTRVSFRGTIKVGFIPSLRGKNPFNFLSFCPPILFIITNLLNVNFIIFKFKFKLFLYNFQIISILFQISFVEGVYHFFNEVHQCQNMTIEKLLYIFLLFFIILFDCILTCTFCTSLYNFIEMSS